MASGLERPKLIIASMYGWFDFCNTFKLDKSSASSAKADQSLFSTEKGQNMFRQRLDAGLSDNMK